LKQKVPVYQDPDVEADACIERNLIRLLETLSEQVCGGKPFSGLFARARHLTVGARVCDPQQLLRAELRNQRVL
jgi:hypothetical protein